MQGVRAFMELRAFLRGSVNANRNAQLNSLAASLLQPLFCVGELRVGHKTGSAVTPKTGEILQTITPSDLLLLGPTPEHPVPQFAESTIQEVSSGENR
jgi:hypothetical protein